MPMDLRTAATRWRKLLALGWWLLRPTPRMATGARVLCYHNVLPSQARRFESHLNCLIATRDVVPLSRLLSELPSLQGPSRLVSITFDDGYRDNYEVALPLLKSRGLSAAFFIVTGMIADTEAGRRAADLPKKGGWSSRLFLTWDELRVMSTSGMEICTHGHWHRRNDKVTRQELDEDLRVSCQLISNRLGVPPIAYAVPFGEARFCNTHMEPVLKGLNIPSALLGAHGANTNSTNPYGLYRDGLSAGAPTWYLRAILSG